MTSKRRRLQPASEREVVWAAVNNDGSVSRIASKELRSDREVVLAAVCKNGSVLRYASKELRSDREVVLAAVNNYGPALQHASEELQSDREVVLAAVNNDGQALEYASEVLRSDREVVLGAVNNSGSALGYASEELRSDREVVLAAVNNAGYALHNASEELRSFREVVLAAVNNHAYALQYASEELRSDREVVLAAVKIHPDALKYAMGDLLSCTTGESVAFIDAVLQTLLEIDYERFCSLDISLSELKAVLIGLSQELKRVDDFIIRGDVMPDVLAQMWIARLEEKQWCLTRLCQNAGVSMDAQQTMEQFTNITRDYQTARQLLMFSPIICMSMKVFRGSFDDGSDWWDNLSNCR